MGYNPCKMVKLRQKLKMQKKCNKKNAPKNIEYSKNDSILKMAEKGHDAWVI